ncbi:MAG TPA: amino acid ABC transporter, partial [Cellvibrionaceae bacterium]
MKQSFKLSLRQLVVGIVLLSTLLTAGTAISLQYYFSRNLAIESATYRYQLTAKATADFVQNAEHRAVQLTRILAQYPTLINTTGNEISMRDLFAEVMRSNPMLYSIYLGFPNGNFYEVVNL